MVTQPFLQKQVMFGRPAGLSKKEIPSTPVRVKELKKLK